MDISIETLPYIIQYEMNVQSNDHDLELIETELYKQYYVVIIIIYNWIEMQAIWRWLIRSLCDGKTLIVGWIVHWSKEYAFDASKSIQAQIKYLRHPQNCHQHNHTISPWNWSQNENSTRPHIHTHTHIHIHTNQINYTRNFNGASENRSPNQIIGTRGLFM